jgi:ketosteroid isomerase-like protein
MKIRLLLTLAGLAIGFALPTVAQETNTPGPQLRGQLLAFTKKIDDAFDNNDAAAMAPLYTDDAVLVAPEGPVLGREAIEKFWIDLFQKVHISNHFCTVDQNSPHIIGTGGNEMWGNGGWGQTVQGQNGGPIEVKGYFSYILVCEGDAWKFRMETWNITPAPPPEPAQANTAPTSSQEQNTVDPKVRQQIEALEMKFQEAYNNRDVAAIAALYTENAAEVWSPGGTSFGLEVIRKMFADEFAKNPGKMVNTIVQVNQISGDSIWETMDTSVGLMDGHAARIFVRDGDTWKIRMTYVRF